MVTSSRRDKVVHDEVKSTVGSSEAINSDKGVRDRDLRE